MSNKQPFLFIFKVVILFFALLFSLYWTLPFYNLILSLLVKPIMIMIYPRFIADIVAKNELLEVVTHFSVTGYAQARLAFEINTLKYSYGLALFSALIISSKAAWQDKAWHIMIGFFILLLAQTWSLCFDITRSLLFEFQGAYSAYFGYNGFSRAMVSLGSQLGFLIFPSLIPIAVWVVLMPDYFRQLIHQEPPV